MSYLEASSPACTAPSLQLARWSHRRPCVCLARSAQMLSRLYLPAVTGQGHLTSSKWEHPPGQDQQSQLCNWNSSQSWGCERPGCCAGRSVAVECLSAPGSLPSSHLSASRSESALAPWRAPGAKPGLPAGSPCCSQRARLGAPQSAPIVGFRSPQDFAFHSPCCR